MSISLCKDIYKISQSLPESEKFNLISQIQKCAVSIPSNIAEGCSRESDLAFKRFLEIALGSSFELETQLLLAVELHLIENILIKEEMEKLNHLQAKMNSLRNKLKNK